MLYYFWLKIIFKKFNSQQCGMGLGWMLFFFVVKMSLKTLSHFSARVLMRFFVDN